MKQGRLDSLADGIFAIVMTILVFEIRVPVLDGIASDLALFDSLVSLYPLFLSYLLSFSLLFTYWRGHHYIVSVLAKGMDIRLSNLSALFFFFVGLVPFSSHLLGAYHYTHVAIIVFAINIILIGISLYGMRRYVIRSHEVENIPFTRTENQHANMRILLPVVIAIIAIGVSFFNTSLALLFFTIAILFNLSRRSTRYMFIFIDFFLPRKSAIE
ncbi:MAG: TMEM175 family protein [Patescibacteria group bacterium]